MHANARTCSQRDHRPQLSRRSLPVVQCWLQGVTSTNMLFLFGLCLCFFSLSLSIFLSLSLPPSLSPRHAHSASVRLYLSKGNHDPVFQTRLVAMAKTFSEYYGSSLNYTCCVRVARVRVCFPLGRAFHSSKLPWERASLSAIRESRLKSQTLLLMWAHTFSVEMAKCLSVELCVGLLLGPHSNDAHTLSGWFWSWSRWSFSTALSSFWFFFPPLALVAHLRTAACRNT